MSRGVNNMTCPYCGGKSRVVDTRHNPDCTIRRYRCTECHSRFYTEESDIKLEIGKKLMSECVSKAKHKNERI